MSRNKKAVPAAADANHRTVTPPVDLWERLEETRLVLVREKQGVPPAGSFTVLDYAAKMGVTRGPAQARILMLFRAGKLKRARIGNRWYYFEGGRGVGPS